MQTTTYKDISGYPGYRVGDDGTVWRLWVNCRWGRKLSDRWRPMKLSGTSRGYLRVNLVPPEGGTYKTFAVHRLVLLTFAGACPDGMECRHLNGIKTDCRLENLCWGTAKQNREDILIHGTRKKGESHPLAKLTENQVREIRSLRAAKVPIADVAKQFGMSLSAVSMITHCRSWKHVS